MFASTNFSDKNTNIFSYRLMLSKYWNKKQRWPGKKYVSYHVKDFGA